MSKTKTPTYTRGVFVKDARTGDYTRQDNLVQDEDHDVYADVGIERHSTLGWAVRLRPRDGGPELVVPVDDVQMF